MLGSPQTPRNGQANQAPCCTARSTNARRAFIIPLTTKKLFHNPTRGMRGTGVSPVNPVAPVSRR